MNDSSMSFSLLWTGVAQNDSLMMFRRFICTALAALA